MRAYSSSSTSALLAGRTPELGLTRSRVHVILPGRRLDSGVESYVFDPLVEDAATTATRHVAWRG